MTTTGTSGSCSSTGDGSTIGELLASPKEAAAAAAGAAASCVVCEGIEFTVTEPNQVAVAVAVATTGCGGGDDGGAAPSVVDSENFLDASTGTRGHFVDVQAPAEAMLFLVYVREDERGIVAVMRC